MPSEGQTGTSLGDPMEAWKARGRELNEVYEAIAETVRAFGLKPTPDNALADLKRLASQFMADRLTRTLALQIQVHATGGDT